MERDASPPERRGTHRPDARKYKAFVVPLQQRNAAERTERSDPERSTPIAQSPRGKPNLRGNSREARKDDRPAPSSVAAQLAADVLVALAGSRNRRTSALNRNPAFAVEQRRPVRAPDKPAPAKPAARPQEPLKLKPAPKPAKAQKPPKGPSYTAPEWTPGSSVAELRAQLDGILLEVPGWLLADPVRPFAIGAAEAFNEAARPLCRQRARRWLRSWCSTTEYLQALAADGGQRHDRTGAAVEPVAPEHQEEARRKLASRQRQRRQQQHPDQPRQQGNAPMDTLNEMEAG